MDAQLTIAQLVLTLMLVVERMYEQCIRRTKRSQCCGGNIEFNSTIDMSSAGRSARNIQGTQAQPVEARHEVIDLTR